MRWQPKWRAQALFALDGLTRRNVALESESIWAADKRAAVLITNDVDVDAKRGLARIAFHAEGRLLAALFAGATHPVALARDHAANRLNYSELTILAGRPRADMPDPGATVCCGLNI